MMRQKNGAAAAALRNFGKKRIARITRRGFNRHLSFLGKRANVCRAEFKIEIVFSGEFFHKARVGVARSSA